MVASAFPLRPLYILQHEVVLVESIYGLVNSLCTHTRRPQSPGSLSDLNTSLLVLTVLLEDQMGCVFPSPPPFILELEGTEPPRRMPKGWAQNCLQTELENQSGFN